MRGIKKLLEEQGIFLRASVVTASSGSALQYDTLISLVRGGGSGWWEGYVMKLSSINNPDGVVDRAFRYLENILARVGIRENL